MNRKWILTVVLVVVAGLAAFALSRRARPAPAPDVMRALQDVAWLTRQLGLTPDQARDVQEAQDELRQRLERCEATHCTARCRLGTVLFGDDDEARSAAVDEMCRMQAESERATLEHIRAVHRLLKPEQQRKYEELVTACVCSYCTHTPKHEVRP